MLYWNIHNQTNMRLFKEEELKNDQDPEFIKRTWPNKEECKVCFDGDK